MSAPPSAAHPRVMALILNWNSSADAVRCLTALRDQPGLGTVLVLDNDSRAGDLDRITTAHPGIATLPLDRNYGYAGGMNAGIRYARAAGMDFVWLLNPDTVPEPDALAQLLKHANRYALSSSRQTTSATPETPGRETYVTAAVLGTLGRPAPVLCAGCPAGAHDVDVVTGASLLIGLDALDQVGPFDERFFHYKEEFDLAFRFSRASLKVGLVCGSEVWHAQGASLSHASPVAGYYYFRNEVLFLRKHWPRPGELVPRFAAQHLAHLMRAGRARLSRDPGARAYARGQLFGYRSGLRGVTGPAPAAARALRPAG